MKQHWKRQKYQNNIEESIKNLRKGSDKSEEQKETLGSIIRLFNSRENVIQLFDDYITTATEARCRAIKEKEIKILAT